MKSNYPIQTFWSRQICQIKEEGMPSVMRKVKKVILRPDQVLIDMICFTLAVIVVLFIRLIRPFVIVRIGKIDIGRLGHVNDGDWYLSEKVDGKHSGRYFDLFYCQKSTSHVNKQWLKMWKRSLPLIYGTAIWKKVHRLIETLPGFAKHIIPSGHCNLSYEEQMTYLDGNDLEIRSIRNDRTISVIKNKKPNIYFTNKELVRGENGLRELGIGIDKSFVCFHSRDSAFLNEVCPQRDWSYHDHRDSNINNYNLALNELVKRGHYGIRMGAIVNKKISFHNHNIIDYATNGSRTNFMDIYLGSKCKFFICGNSGISTIPEVFKKPVVYINFCKPEWAPGWVSNGLVIFKKLYIKKEKRLLSFSEIMRIDMDREEANKIIADLGLEVLENTPEEIKAVTIEMDDRLNASWQTTEEDEELQQRFWALFGPDKLKSPGLRIGAEYLRENKDLLVRIP